MLKGKRASMPEGSEVIGLAVGPKDPILQFLRLEMAGLEDDVLPVVLGPIVMKNPPILFQILK